MDFSHIKTLLREQGKTQADLAELLGRDKSAVTHLLKGTRQLKADEVVKISQFLAVSPLEILGIEDWNAEEKREVKKDSLTEVENSTSFGGSGIISLPLISLPTPKLQESKQISVQNGRYYYQTFGEPDAVHFVLEVIDQSMDLSGIVAEDVIIAKAANQVAMNAIAVIKLEAENDIRYVLRRYQSPFLRAQSTRDGFEQLHQDRASVSIIGEVVRVERNYS